MRAKTGSGFSIKAIGSKVKKEAKVLRQVEDQLQKACEQWLKLKNITYIHLPKGAQRYLWNPKFGIPVQVAAEASRALKGVPDLILFGTDRNFLMIELKSEKGKLTPEQKRWLDFGMIVCKDFDTFQKIVEEWQARR